MATLRRSSRLRMDMRRSRSWMGEMTTNPTASPAAAPHRTGCGVVHSRDGSGDLSTFGDFAVVTAPERSHDEAHGRSGRGGAAGGRSGRTDHATAGGRLWHVAGRHP